MLNEGKGLKNARRLMRLTAFGIPVEWEEQPFGWTRPTRFGVVRRYRKGPIMELRGGVDLTPSDKPSDSPFGNRTGVGTKLVGEIWAKSREVIELIAIPRELAILSARR